MIYGYARCSTDETKQDVSRQIQELIKLGTKRENIYFEYESGTKEDRTELNKLLNVVGTGDTITATEASRITRSTKQLCEIIEIAKNKKIKLVFGTFVVDCTNGLDAMTEGMLKLLGVFAELERNIIAERVKSGLLNAKAKGKVLGRPETTAEDIPEKFYKLYTLYKCKKINKAELARVCNISYPTVFKYIKIIERKN